MSFRRFCWMSGCHKSTPPIRPSSSISDRAPVPSGACASYSIWAAFGKRCSTLSSIPNCSTPAPPEPASSREAIGALEGADPDRSRWSRAGPKRCCCSFSLRPGRRQRRSAATRISRQRRDHHGVWHRSAALRFAPENQFRIDLDEIRHLVDRNTRLVLAISPHNPTGATLSDRGNAKSPRFLRRRAACSLCATRFITPSITDPKHEPPPVCRMPRCWETSRRRFASAGCALVGLLSPMPRDAANT